ncbi:hypothetical protein ACF0H5_016112 [Mactra antiquata]
MTSIIQTVKSCMMKKPASEQVEVVTRDTQSTVLDDPDDVKENEAQDFTSNKKTDEQSEQKPQSGFVWRMSTGLGSGLYNVTTGAVGYSVGGVKWVAGKSYDAGAAVASHIKVPPIPKLTKRKDKKE